MNIKNYFLVCAIVIICGGTFVHSATAPLKVATDDKFTGADVTAAKAFLKTRINRTGRTSCPAQPFTPDNSIDPLNPAFAQCVAAFIQKYEAAYPGVKMIITSAFRSPTQQKCVCPSAVPGKCGSVGSYNPKTGQVEGGSNHQRGIAVDVNPSDGDYSKLHAFARANPSLGVSFPLGMTDRVHMQPTSKSDPKCVTQGQRIEIPPEGQRGPDPAEKSYTPAPYDSTGALVQEVQQTDAGGNSPSGGSQPSSFMDGIRSLFSSEPQTPPQSIPATESGTIFCSDQFGSDQKGCEDSLVRGLLGEDLGVTDDAGLTEDTVADVTGDSPSPLQEANDCTDGVSRNGTSCLQVRTQSSVPAPSGIGGASVRDTITDPAVRLVGPALSSSVEDFVWSPGSERAPVQYASFEYFNGTDIPSSMYFDSYTGQYRYRSTGEPVPAGLLHFVLSDDTSQSANVSGVSWGTVWSIGSSFARAALPSFGFTIPTASFFAL